MTRDEILAMEPGPILDRLVASRVMGYEDCHDGIYNYRQLDRDSHGHAIYLKRVGIPDYSTWIDPAGQVMEKLYDDGWIVSLGSLAQKPRGWRCELLNMWEDDFEKCPTHIEANGSIVSEAISKAALLTKMDKEATCQE